MTREFFTYTQHILALYGFPIVCVLGVAGNCLAAVVLCSRPPIFCVVVRRLLLSLAVCDTLKLLNDLLYTPAYLLKYAGAAPHVFRNIYPFAFFINQWMATTAAWFVVLIAWQQFVCVCSSAPLPMHTHTHAHTRCSPMRLNTLRSRLIKRHKSSSVSSASASASSVVVVTASSSTAAGYHWMGGRAALLLQRWQVCPATFVCALALNFLCLFRYQSKWMNQADNSTGMTTGESQRRLSAGRANDTVAMSTRVCNAVNNSSSPASTDRLTSLLQYHERNQSSDARVQIHSVNSV